MIKFSRCRDALPIPPKISIKIKIKIIIERYLKLKNVRINTRIESTINQI